MPQGSDDPDDREARDRIMRIVMARCGDVLTTRDIAHLLVDDELIPGHIVMQVMEVIDRMSERLAVYEAKFAEPEPLPERLH